jgi:hypothetical protein
LWHQNCLDPDLGKRQVENVVRQYYITKLDFANLCGRLDVIQYKLVDMQTSGNLGLQSCLEDSDIGCW